MSNVFHIKDDEFEKEVLQSDKIILLDFWATWCGPCRMLSPILDQIADEMKDQIKVVKMSVDECEIIPARFMVRSIPTLVLMKDGEVLGAQIGALTKGQLKSFIESRI